MGTNLKNRKVLSSPSIKSIWDPDKKDGDPSFIHVNDPPKDSGGGVGDDLLAHQTTHSTAKPIERTADGATTVPTQSPDNCDGDVDLENNIVNIRCGNSRWISGMRVIRHCLTSTFSRS